MNAIHKNIIKLVKSGLTGDKVVLSSDLDWNAIMFLCQTHELIPLLYYGLQNSVDTPPNKLYDQLENLVVKYIVNDMTLEKMYADITSAFEESEINYMPLKGIITRRLYPKPEMRVMSDIDILVKEEQQKKACVVMKAHGYNFEIESAHEFVFSKNKTKAEIHKSLVPDYNVDFYDYFKTGWEKAIPDGNNKYKMSEDDEFIYMFTHLAKHYRDSGINVIHLIDIWMYMQSCKLNMDYIKTELEGLGLYTFFENVYATLNNWFGDGEATEMTEFITDKMFSFGCWGTPLNSSLSKTIKETNNGAKKNVKSIKIKNFLFPPYNVMRASYPMVNGRKYLLPVAWLVRFTKLPFKRNSVNKLNNEISSATPENVEKYKNDLKYVGLEYRFDEKEK